MSLTIGNNAPDFALPSTKGTLTLSKDLHNKACIIYFYPKDFTSVCTKEACSFRNEFEIFKNLDIDVLGISRDNVETHARFKAQYELPFELCADVDGKVAEKYKAIVPWIGLTKRITYLLDASHTISAVYSSFFESAKHVQEMIDEVKKIKL